MDWKWQSFESSSIKISSEPKWNINVWEGNCKSCAEIETVEYLHCSDDLVSGQIEKFLTVWIFENIWSVIRIFAML